MLSQKKELFSPLIGNIRLSFHTYINSLSRLFVLFFCCRWDIFWFGGIVRTELTFLGRNLYFILSHVVESHFVAALESRTWHPKEFRCYSQEKREKLESSDLSFISK